MICLFNEEFFYLISALIEMYISGSELENFQILTIRGSLLKKNVSWDESFHTYKKYYVCKKYFFSKKYSRGSHSFVVWVVSIFKTT